MKKNTRQYTADNIRTFDVKEETTLLPFLFDVLDNLSRSEVKSMLKFKHVALQGKAVTQFDTPLLPGDQVQVNFGRSFYKFNNPQVKVLYEDKWMVVIEKASGLLSVANETAREKNAFHIVQDYVRHDNPDARLFVCHRLDQYTSGILVFAKDEQLMQEMRANWDFYVKERKYICVTENVPTHAEDTVQSLLVEDEHMRVHSTNDDVNGRMAVTHYRVLQSRGRYALVDVEIFTGKKNQIRVHMSEMGCPIAGDIKYGAETNPARRLMLHNYRLSFIHPVSGEMMRFSLSTPPVFRKLTSPEQ
ncbi:MAG: RluA family pseudouridine synthase [Bacteroidaceae bacterium]|nr:RluA family pseudouridine synthase [Candidatus Colenecus caballi]MCQ2072434.1 RluA family pseudouridine synthase [Bacteroidaceae bacterium]